MGAGIAGVAAAYELTVNHGIGRVVIVDPLPPLSLTSDKSTECYRNWWPNLPMVGLMSRSIDLLEKMAAHSGNVFALSRRGYLFVTAEDERFHRMVEDAHHTSTLGAGPVRFHPGPIPYRASPAEGFTGVPEGADILVGSPKYGILSKLASNFAGQKYDLNDPGHRKQMRMRLLRMFQPRAKPILKELAEAYFGRFGRPLRVTSLTRSMDYQILLNASNPNSFKVRGEGSLPPHTSGCAFDLARKHMPAEEQNFVMAKLAEMERAGKLDALIEYGTNACFHVFIYHDGVAPRM